MELKKNQTYKTPAGLFLKIKTIRETGMHTLNLVDNKGKIIPERRNTRGHIIQRAERLCSEETIRSFKKVSLATMLLFSSFCFSQKSFVLSANSKHKVEMTEHLSKILFDGRVYEVDNSGRHKGWYRMKNDSITWVFGHAENDQKDMIKVGFYNDFKSYVLSIKTDKK